MKGKGKGATGDSGWGFPNPGKGKAKGTKCSWNPGKGAWGKGAEGAYSVEDDWSAGYSGYNFEDIPLFLNSLAQEAGDEWQVVKSKKSSKYPSPAGGKPPRFMSTST